MPVKRIILMYISEVSGHRSAASAIENAIKSIRPETEILSINAFNYTNPISEKIINSLYMTVIKNMPRVWDYLYDNPKVIKNLETIKKAIHKVNSAKLKSLFDKFRPDVVACSQAFPCGMVADFKRIYKSELPLVAVLTDYVPHSYWIYDNIDFYIAPSEEVGEKLRGKGVPAHRIKPFGIPFDMKFNLPVDKEKVYSGLGLDKAKPVILIMGGGHGLGPIKSIIASLEKSKHKIQGIIITGNNEKLYNSLRKNISKFRQKFSILPYVSNVNELMGVSDIIITKPGGITTAEALAKRLPMIIINPIPGQEASNAAYLTKAGAALRTNDLKNINLLLDELLDNPEKLAAMKEASGNISKPNASIDAAKLILGIENNV